MRRNKTTTRPRFTSPLEHYRKPAPLRHVLHMRRLSRLVLLAIDVVTLSVGALRVQCHPRFRSTLLFTLRPGSVDPA